MTFTERPGLAPKVQAATPASPLDAVLDEWLCPDCPSRDGLAAEIQAGLDSREALLQTTGRFAMRYLEASSCAPDEICAACGNIAVQGALGFMLEAQTVSDGTATSQSV